MSDKTPQTADLVLLAGDVHTMDPALPRAEALSVAQGRILTVGRISEVKPQIGPHTRVIDLAGRSITPGLVDGHCHLAGLGRALEQLDLRGTKHPEEVAEAVAQEAQKRPPGEWISGYGWDQNLWSPPAFPTRHLLDRVSPHHPVALRRIDGHALWANSAALAAAGIQRGSADPAGGLIVRDADGEPTGVLLDYAIDLVEGRIPPPTVAVYRRWILTAAQLAASSGLTGVHEMGIEEAAVEAYRGLAVEGKLPLRVHAFFEGKTRGKWRLDDLKEIVPDADPDGTSYFALRGIKLYADGALGSRGAALLAPYCDDPQNRGLSLLSPEELRAALRFGAEGGWQMAVHAIGDAANRAVLDAMEEAGVHPALRWRIEHAQIIAPEDLPRFARLGVIAAVQPSHATSDLPWAEARLGKERLRGAYAWRSLLQAGARLVGGSDFPIEEHPPLFGLYAAVTRQDRSGRPVGGWFPEERLSLPEVLSLYTAEAAYASFTENHRGRLSPGFVADLTVFDRPLSEETLLQTSVDMTIVGGVVVYERS